MAYNPRTSGLYESLLPSTQKALLEKWSNIRTKDLSPGYNLSAFGKDWESGGGQSYGAKTLQQWQNIPSGEEGQSEYSGGAWHEMIYALDPLGKKKTTKVAAGKKHLGKGWEGHQMGMSGSRDPFHMALAQLFMAPKGGKIWQPNVINEKERRLFKKSDYTKTTTFSDYYQPDEGTAEAFTEGEGGLDWSNWGGHQPTWEESALGRMLYKHMPDLWEDEAARSVTKKRQGVSGTPESDYKSVQTRKTGGSWSY